MLPSAHNMKHSQYTSCELKTNSFHNGGLHTCPFLHLVIKSLKNLLAPTSSLHPNIMTSEALQYHFFLQTSNQHPMLNITIMAHSKLMVISFVFHLFSVLPIDYTPHEGQTVLSTVYKQQGHHFP